MYRQEARMEEQEEQRRQTQKKQETQQLRQRKKNRRYSSSGRRRRHGDSSGSGSSSRCQLLHLLSSVRLLLRLHKQSGKEGGKAEQSLSRGRVSLPCSE